MLVLHQLFPQLLLPEWHWCVSSYLLCRFWWTVMFDCDSMRFCLRNAVTYLYTEIFNLIVINKFVDGKKEELAWLQRVPVVRTRAVSCWSPHQSGLPPRSAVWESFAVHSCHVLSWLWLYLDVFLPTRFQGWLLNKKIMTWRAWARGEGRGRMPANQLAYVWGLPIDWEWGGGATDSAKQSR